MKTKTSKKKEKPETALKFTGFMVWMARSATSAGDDLTHDRYEIQRAVLRDDRELAIDFNANDPTEAPFVYTVILYRSDSLVFRGEWQVGKGTERNSGSCSCRLYSNGSRYAFFGIWKQDTATQDWIGELIPVESFDDESRESK